MPNRSYIRDIKFKPSLLAETKKLMGRKPLLRNYQAWNKATSRILGVPEPHLVITERPLDQFGEQVHMKYLMFSGFYIPDYITLIGFDPVVLAHEFRHHLQKYRKTPRGTWGGKACEEDARIWSINLCRQANPTIFKKMVKQGEVLGVILEDLK